MRVRRCASAVLRWLLAVLEPATPGGGPPVAVPEVASAARGFPFARRQGQGLSKTSSNPAPPTGDIAATWTHRLAADHTLLVAFSYRLPSGSIKARSSCFLSDLQDGQKSIDWLSRWTGAKIPSRPFATYYFGLDAGRPKLFPVPGASSPPPTAAGGDLYALHVESFGQATEISLGVSDPWKSKGMAATSSPRGSSRSAPA